MRRPPLQPPLLWQLWLLFWICGSLAALWPWPALAASTFLLFFSPAVRSPARAAASLALFATAWLWAQTTFERAANIDLVSPAWVAPQNKETGVCGEIIAAHGLAGQRLRLILANVRPENGGDPLPGYCALTWEYPPPNAAPLPGMKICLNRKISRARALVNDDGDEIHPQFAAKQIYWRAFLSGRAGSPRLSGNGDFSNRLRRSVRLKFDRALSGDAMPTQAQALLPALVFGDRFYIAPQTQERFAAASLAHSLALSGQHLCVTALFGLILVLAHSRLYPAVYLRWPRRLLAAVFALPFALAYLWLGDAPASLTRAVCMLLALAWFVWRAAPFTGVDLLAAALLLILALNPLAIYDLGLQLSALCLAILTISAPLFNKLISRFAGGSILKRLALRGAQILSVSLLIQVFILPLNLKTFHLAGYLFALNLLWLPLLGLVVLPFAALGLILSLFPWLDSAASGSLALAAAPCRFILSVLRVLDDWSLFNEPAFLEPAQPVFLAFLALLAVLFWLPGRARRRGPQYFLLAVVLLLAAPPATRFFRSFDDGIYVEALDVGQGQAIRVKTTRAQILIDGGGSATGRFDIGKNVVRPALADNARPRVDALINSHPDLDHLGGFFHLLKTFQIGRLFHNGREANERFAALWRQARDAKGAIALAEGDVIQIGAAKDSPRLEVLWPPRDDTREGNDASLILRLARANQSLAVIPGDAGPDALAQVARKYPELKSALLVAPHHGSDKNFNKEFLAAVAPNAVFISCGYGNRWGFPGSLVLAWFKSRGVPVYLTSRLGRLVAAFDRDGALDITSALNKR